MKLMPTMKETKKALELSSQSLMRLRLPCLIQCQETFRLNATSLETNSDKPHGAITLCIT